MLRKAMKVSSVVVFAVLMLVAFSDANSSEGCKSTCKSTCGSKVDSASKQGIVEGNVWTTADGQRYFTCPVQHTENPVANAVAHSDVDGVRYYHCCPSSQAPFRAEPGKFLKAFAIPGNVLTVDADGKKHFADPISGKEGVVSKKTKYADVEGMRYFFASKKSLKKFNSDPHAFLQKMGSKKTI